MKWYWIHANIDGRARWHMVLDKDPGMYFVESDFEEDEYDIEDYRKDFPHNEVVEVLNVHQTKHPLGICEEHMKAWSRVECPLCDLLFVHDRLKVAIEVIGTALETLSKIPDTGNEDEDLEKDEEARGQACIMLEKFLKYAQSGNEGPCTCDEVGESRCPKHGWEDMISNLRAYERSNYRVSMG